MALAALRNALPARQFSHTVLYNLALRYTLTTDRPERYIEAFAMALETPGMGGAGNFRQMPVESPSDYMHLVKMLPAFHAAGETATAEQIFSRLSAFFDNASDTLRHHETPYVLQLFSGDVEGALDTLEKLIDDGRGGLIPSWSTNLSELRWWLEFDGILAEPLKNNPRYSEILDKRQAHIDRERQAILAIINNESEATLR
jgi:hypothetical protein